MTTLLTASDFKSGSLTRRFRTETCPWDEAKAVRVRSLSEREQSTFEAATVTKSGGLKTERLKDAKRRYIALCVCDEEGNPILTANDVREMDETDARLIQWVYKIATEHNGIDESDVEELAGN